MEYIEKAHIETVDPMIEVTLWSRTPLRTYMPVSLDMVALPDLKETVIVLTRPDGMSMAIHLTAAGVVELAKELAAIQQEFKRGGDRHHLQQPRRRHERT